MTARTIANRLLEADEDFNVHSELERLSTSGYPGYEIESEGRHWNVYKKVPGTAGHDAFIGEITYDDMADMPKETMTPENIEYWNTHHWYASAGFRINERQFCASFAEAIQWIIAVNIAKTTPPITQKLDKDDLNNLYSDVCLELFDTRDTGALSQADYEALEQEVTRRQKQLRRRPQEALVNVREAKDPDDPSENIERFATERSAPVEMRFINHNGRPFRVRLVWDKESGGTTYNDQGEAVPEKLQPTVEFYDMTLAKDPKIANSSFKDYGQYVSSYYAATLIERRPHEGLDLHGGQPAWNIDGNSMDTVMAWIKEQVESRGYKLVKNEPGDISFGWNYEALDPDDPEPYLHPERFSGQPSYERIESDLRIMLRPYYNEIRINRRPAKFADIFKCLTDHYTWTIHCTRDQSLKLPSHANAAQWGNPIDWKKQVTQWFEDWAERSGFRLDHFAIYGRLRKDPTFQFTTWRIKSRPPMANQPIKENEEDLKPEDYVNHIVATSEASHELLQDLWKFHPYGVGYNAVLNYRGGVVSVQTYFPPEKDNFILRFQDFVLNWVKEHKVMTVTHHKLTTQPLVVDENYPRWGIMLALNSDWPSDQPAYGAAPVEIGPP